MYIAHENKIKKLLHMKTEEKLGAEKRYNSVITIFIHLEQN